MKKIVFTGGFSSGKTTTINMLKNLGYNVLAESSELLINDYRNRYGYYPWDYKDNLLEFHKQVFYQQLEDEEKINGDMVFLDRGILDRLAFLEFDNLPIPDELLNLAKLCCDDEVLFFEGDESIYKKDLHRPHDIDSSREAEKLMRKAYENLGYNIIIMPFCSKEERLEIILRNYGNKL